jgi:hypothetical protein
LRSAKNSGKVEEFLTVYSLKEDVENAVARDCKFVFVEEVVLNSLLIVFIAVEVVILKVIQKSTGDSSDSFDVHLRAAELLLAMLNRVLKIFESEDQLKQTVRV